MSVTIEKVGARLYLVGDTFPIKAEIKEAGGHWDGDRRQWWVGGTKRDAIEKLIATPPKAAEEAPYDGQVMARAVYKDKSCYVRWHGTTARGEAYRLVSFDGKRQWWANPADVRVTKEYQQGARGYPTLRWMKEARKHPQRVNHREYVEMLEDMDCFDEAREYAQAHGVPY